MNESTSDILDQPTASALFANMVLQQTNMALIFLGKSPNPETGEVVHDLRTAKIIIDQLEMLAMKTRGNLDARESALLNESLTAVRMAFVESVERQSKAAPPSARSAPSPAKETEKAATADTASTTPDPAPAAAEDAESRKKFTKKY